MSLVVEPFLPRCVFKMADKNSPGTSPHREPGGRDPAGTPNQNPESVGATSNPRKVGLANLGVTLTSPSSDSLLTELNSQATKTRKSSFQITRVVDTVGLTDVDSLDDLDEGTNTEMDRSSESREASKLTGEMISDQYDTVTTTVDTLRSPSPGGLESLSVAGEKLTSSPQNDANSSLPSSVRRSSSSSAARDKPQTLTPQSDIQSRFKIVKIINNVRGRWTCLDFSGPPANDTTSNDSKCSSTLGSRSASAVDVTKPILYVANNPTTANETLVCGADGTLVHLQNISEFIKTLPEQVNSASSLTPDTIAKVLGALNAQQGGGMVNGNVEINPSLLSNVVPQTRSLVPSSSHIISTTFAEESREYDSNEILLTGIRSKSDPVFVVETGDVKLAGEQEENGSSVVLRRNESTGAVDTVQDSAEYTDSASAISALDDKIEQAMDLVKSHLMFAVHEEVEVLKDQIKELMIKNTQLEMENHLLRTAATTETLAKIDGTQPPPTTKTDFT